MALDAFIGFKLAIFCFFNKALINLISITYECNVILNFTGVPIIHEMND